MPIYLLMAAVVIFACVILNRVSNKLGIPMLLAFILLGMFFGSDGLLKIPFDNYAFAEQICSIALIFIMFYGGFGTNWKEAQPVALKAVLLSTFGVILTAGLTGLFCHFALRIGWLESFLIGSVIGSTDAASVFSILRSKRLNLKYNTASLLEVESGSNDPCSYMLTAILIAVLKGSANRNALLYAIFAQIVYGVLFGIVIAAACVWFLKRVKFTTAGFDAIFVVAIALLSYAAPAALGGNGYLSAYIVGIVLGNSEIRNKRSLVHFFDGTTGLMQMLIFFLLGLLAFPSRLPQVALPALLIALFLTFVARPVAVFAILSPLRSKISQQIVVSWAGLRGAASIVFAIMAVMAVDTQYDIFHIVFFIVLFSILLQGSLLPTLARKLGMLDENADVLKTFNDYSNEVPIQFIQFSLTPEHSWCGRALRDIELPPDTIVALLQRDGNNLVPKGSTVLMQNDTLILSAISPGEIEGVQLSEIKLNKHNDYIGKTLAELPKTENSLVIMIQRAGKIIIPKGDTTLEANDILVINRSE